MINDISHIIYTAVNESFDFNTVHDDIDDDTAILDRMLTDNLSIDDIISSQTLDKPNFYVKNHILYITGDIIKNKYNNDRRPEIKSIIFLNDLHCLLDYNINKLIISANNGDNIDCCIKNNFIPENFIIDTNCDKFIIFISKDDSLLSNCEIHAGNLEFNGYNKNLVLDNVKFINNLKDNNLSTLTLSTLTDINIKNNCKILCTNLVIEDPKEQLESNINQLKIADVSSIGYFNHILSKYKKDTKFDRTSINIFDTLKINKNIFNNQLQRIFILFDTVVQAKYKGIILYNKNTSYIPKCFKKNTYTFVYDDNWIGRENSTHFKNKLEHDKNTW